MLKPASLLTLLLTAFLTACGGGGGGDSVVAGNDDSSSSGDTTTVDNGDGTTDDVTTSTDITNPLIGTGSGSSFVSGALNISSTSLSAGGTANITATIVDGDNGNAKVVSQQYGVVFTSICAESDPAKASFSREQVVTSSGEISVTYTAEGCSGTDVLSFKLYATNDGEIDLDSVLDAASGTITVQAPEVGAITFVENSEPAISISTIANPVLPVLSEVVFRVLDRTNNPIGGKEVTFALSNTPGGARLALGEGVTNEDGEVKAILQSGTTHGVTSVVATTLANDGVTEISTSSQPVSITTGLADQDSFSIALDTFNPGAFDVSGTEVSVTAFAADQFQNPVPDGTVINFTAESGAIESYCATEGGRCSVTWYSAGDRPGQHAAGLNRVNEVDQQTAGTVYGMTTIMAYTMGESGFTDQNNNGLFDASEPFVTYPEAFRDDDWDGAVDVGGTSSLPVEFFADFDYDGSYDAAPATYQGALCTDAAKGLSHCGSLMNVRANIRLMQSTATVAPTIRFFEQSGTVVVNGVTVPAYTENTPTLAGSGTFYVVLQDANGNIPASGTIMGASGDGYKITGTSGPVPNSIGILDPTGAQGLPSFGAFYTVNYSAETSPISIEVTATSGDSVNSYELN